jgi:hypothetical protein
MELMMLELELFDASDCMVLHLTEHEMPPAGPIGLRDIHVQIGDHAFSPPGREWMIALALELRTPYIIPRYIDNGQVWTRERLRSEVDLLYRKYDPAGIG